MAATIAKWGNSLGVRIPSIIAKQTGLFAGRDVVFDVQDGNIILRPLIHTREKGDIEALIAKITPENKQELVFSGPVIGKENVIW